MRMDQLSVKAGEFCVRIARAYRAARYAYAWLAGPLMFFAPPLNAQTFVPTVTIGGGIQTSYDYEQLSGAPGLDQFSLGHARLYLSGDITSNISFMFNTDYSSITNEMQVLDGVGEFHTSPKFNVWFGRFLPPSDRANLYGPFYSNEWLVFTDGIQDGYTSVYQGRDDGVAYWGDFKAGIAKIKASVGVFDGTSSDGIPALSGPAASRSISGIPRTATT